MYEKYYGFAEKPFSIVPNPKYLYLSEKHANALTFLEYGLSEKTGFILLTGEIGAGKTTLVRYFLEKVVAKETLVAEVFNTNVTPEQLLALVLREFNLSAANADKAANLEILQKFLADRFAENKHALLIIDEAQNLSIEALEEVRLLSNLQYDGHLLLQIMLVGQPELKLKMRAPGLVQFSQRITVRFHLPPLKKDETANYIANRLEKAGGDPGLFTTEAVAIIYQASKGIPRMINLLCDAALVYGYADDMVRIEAALIQSIIRENDGIGIAMASDSVARADSRDGDQALPSDMFGKIHSIEKAVSRLESRFEYQILELEKRANGFKEDMRQLVDRLLNVERKRSDILLVQYKQLKQQYDTLLKKTNTKKNT